MGMVTRVQRWLQSVINRPEPGDDELPLPSRQFYWYLAFWHVVYLGALALLLGHNLLAARGAPGRPQALLAGLTAVQVVLYAWNFMYNDVWPLPGWRNALYFVGSLALWTVEWRLDPNYFWLVLSYLGQMFGILSPAAAIPSTGLIFLLFFAEGRNWNFNGLTLGEVGGALLGWVSLSVLFLFVNVVSRTSQERALLIQQLRAAQRELEAARAHDAELGALRERERLARELHDSLGHALVVISVQLEAIQRLYRVNPAQADERIEVLKGVARNNMDELRRALTGLRSAQLGDRPLGEALQTLCVQTGQRSGLELACRAPADGPQLTPAAAEALWRVAQEALSNVERHAQARHVELRLEVQPSEAILRVSDDGRGLPAGAETLPEHFGLRGMRERVEGLGGTLALRREAGTVVEARIPVV
jgi:signal transduction histidine kinase